MTTYRLYPTNPSGFPTSSTSVTDPVVFQLGFTVTESGLWLDGYWWPVIDASQATTGVEFALYQVTGSSAGTLIANSTVSAGTLSIGWNFVPLPTPLNLTGGGVYRAAVGYTAGNMPHSTGYFASGGAGQDGITNGPLFAYGEVSGYEDPYNNAQMTYTLSSSNPAVGIVGSSSGNNYWLDVQVDTSAPAGAAYQLMPNYPVPAGAVGPEEGVYTLGQTITLSQTCTMNEFWFYSGPGCTALPQSIALYNTSTQAIVSGTANTSPTWSGAAGSGWVSCTYSSPPTVTAGTYALAAFGNYASTEWFMVVVGQWTTGVFSGGITNGPVSAPSGATSPCYYTGGSSITFPANEAGSGNGEGYQLDALFTPSGAGSDTGTGAVALPKMSLTGSGTVTGLDSGTGSVALPKMSLSGSGGEGTIGTGSVALPKMSLSGAGGEGTIGTGSVALPKMSLSGGGEAESGSGSVALPKMSLSGAGGPLTPDTGTGSVALPKMRVQGSQVTQATTSRSIVRQGIAAYFGGTFSDTADAYQNGPLTSYGLGSVRIGYAKRTNQQDFFVGMQPGVARGAVVIVAIGRAREGRRTMAGAPEVSSGNIIGGGWKQIIYPITLDGYFLSEKSYAEDAEEALDVLIEAIIQQLRYDRTLGGICLDAGETRAGVTSDQTRPSIGKNEAIIIDFSITFEVRVNIIA